MTVPDLASVLYAAVAIVVNAAVVYGVVSTKIEWIRADVDRLQGDLHGVRSEVRDMRDRVVSGGHAAGLRERLGEREAFPFGGRQANG